MMEGVSAHESSAILAAVRFRSALDDYIEARIRYDKAREAFGDGYDWDYFGAADIESLTRAALRLDTAFVEAVKIAAADAS